MSAATSARAGWCPGALNPMMTGDGLIVRIKPRLGRLSPEQARGIAQASQAFGNGDLDLTARANLQIRGANARRLPGLIRALDGLGLIDPSSAAEAVRNVVSSPLAGFDASAILDVRDAVTTLETRLVEDSTLHTLPAKFNFVIDDGGRLGLADVTADIRFEACLEGDMPAFAVRLGGAEDAAAGLCMPSDIGEVAAALIGIFLDAQTEDADIRRMRLLVERSGAEAILRRGGLKLFWPARGQAASFEQFIGAVIVRPPPSSLAGGGGTAGPPAVTEEGFSGRAEPLNRPTQPSLRWLRKLGSAGRLLPQGKKGGRAQLQPYRPVVTVLGVAAPFGRLTAGQLERLASAASEGSAAELRLTPWRAILVPVLTAECARRIAAVSTAAGLIVDAADPRLRIAACPGASGCHRGTTPVLDHAAHLSALLEPGQPGTGILLHVSGCKKGCAHAGKAPLTLVGQDGAYGIVVEGSAADQPSLEGLGFNAAARYVTRSTRMEQQS